MPAARRTTFPPTSVGERRTRKGTSGAADPRSINKDSPNKAADAASKPTVLALDQPA
jgi:hypothetical protein